MASNLPRDILNKLDRRWAPRAPGPEGYRAKTDRAKRSVRAVPEGAKPLPDEPAAKKADQPIR